MASMKELPETPSSKSICYMAAAILGQDDGVDNRDPYWPEVVRMAERTYEALYASLETKEQ